MPVSLDTAGPAFRDGRGTGYGVALMALEAGPRLIWFHQVRGLMTIAKLLLICSVRPFWDSDYRLPILLLVVVIASVGSHMTSRWRYYSVIYREVIASYGGPGTNQLPNETRERDQQDNSRDR